MSLISVIVPIYNVEKYLSRCVDCVLSQTFTDFEIILVDDGSPDNCGKICDDYAKKDKRIHVIHKNNGGLSEARNYGIDWVFMNSDSEWITFIDSDDWVHPEYLRMLFRAVKKYNTDFSICGFDRTERMIEFESTSVEEIKIVNAQEFFINNKANAVVAWGKLYRKSLFQDIRYPVGKLHEDEFTTHKIYFKFKEIPFVDASLYYYYNNNESIMNSPWSPKRLDLLEALYEKMFFFKKNSLKKMYHHQILNLFYLANLQLDLLIKTNNQDYIDKYTPYISKMIRKMMRLGRKEGIFKFSENRPYYDRMYPRLMNIYWILNGKFSKE